MTRRKSDEPRTYIRVAVSTAKRITDDAKAVGLSVSEYMKTMRLVPINKEGFYLVSEDPKEE